MKSKDAQEICVTTSGTMPMLARLATVLLTLPSMDSEGADKSVVASVVSTLAQTGPFVQLFSWRGSRPVVLRS